MKPLHIVNYGFPHIDGYVVRTLGLVHAQARTLRWEPRVAVGPFPAFTTSTDPEFHSDWWHDDQPTLGESRDWERPGVGFAPVAERSMGAALDAMVERERPDVLHVHHPHFLTPAVRRVATARGIPMVYEVRCFNGDYDLDRRHPYYRRIRGPRFNQLEYRACRAADAVVTISDALAARIVEQTGIEHVHVIRNSVDTSLFGPDDADHGSGTTADPARLRVGYATTFEPIESLEVLVRALDGARRQLAGEVDLRAVIAGQGRTFDDIARLRRELDADWLELPGFVPYHQMPELLRSLDLFVVPRTDAAVAQATTPLKPLEALASGVPVLATDLPAARELLSSNPAVTFCEPSETGIAQGVVEFARGPRRTEISTDRTWADEVHHYEAAYQQAKEQALT